MKAVTYQTILDHCLDAIRQYVMCAGSTTLIPTQFYEGAKRNYIDSDQMHTCRSFEYLREFAYSRAPGGTAYVPRDKSVIDTRKHELSVKTMEDFVDHRQMLAAIHAAHSQDNGVHQDHGDRS